jgi:hypothetical protein
MSALLSLFGGALGGVGFLLMLIAAVSRLTGHYYLGGFEVMSLFNGGVGIMVAGCFVKLHLLTLR